MMKACPLERERYSRFELGNVMINWNKEAKRVLRAELVRRQVGYKQLSALLEGLGVVETERSIASKISRGAFSFAFFLQCMKALRRPSIEIDLTDVGE
jgi:Domain of unknown function (DUF6471)